MDAQKIGQRIAMLRRSLGMTQKELADLLYLSDRTISKWERAAGLPDVSVWEPLAEVLGVTVHELVSDNGIRNPKDGGNMKRTTFYVCPHCGNILTASSDAQLSCCGNVLHPLEAKQEDALHHISIETIDGENYVQMRHEMNKQHYISFFAFLTGDKLYLNRLYPEGACDARFPLSGMGTLYAYCTNDGLYRKYVRRKR